MSTCEQLVGLANTRISTGYDAQISPGSLKLKDIHIQSQMKVEYSSLHGV